MYENDNTPEPAGGTAPKHRRRVLTGLVAASVAVLGTSLIGISAASAATPAGGHVAAISNSGGGSGSGGGGGNSGTWDQTKVPLPHLPGQAPVFDRGFQTQKVADVVSLDQSSEAAANASMIAFYQNNTACTVQVTPGPGDIQDTITCPHGTATSSDAVDDGTQFQVFRLVH